MEFVSPEGLRLDGRRPKELRRLQAEIGCLANANGSATFEMGNTKVTAAVYGPHEVSNRADMLHDRALLCCEVAAAAFSSGERRKRAGGDRRTAEITRAVKGTLEQTIISELLPRCQIDVFIQILVSDGSATAACINAAMLAFANAGIPLRDMVAACTVGYLESTPLLDVNHIEETGDGAVLTLASHPNRDLLPLLQLDEKLPMETLEQVMDLANDGTKAVSQWLRGQLLQHVQQLAVCRNIAAVS